MKKGFYVLVLIGCVLNLMFTVSCNKTKTFEELKSDEKKVIKKILHEKNITVLSEYPSDGVFGENEFVQLSTGIYLNVVDSGNGERAVYGETDLLLRVSGEYYYGDTARAFSTFTNAESPFEFKYGYAYNVVSTYQYSYSSSYYYFFSMGLESILSYVGDSATVKLIVPGYSEISSYPAGSTMQSADGNTFVPIYYDRVRYVFYK